MRNSSLHPGLPIVLLLGACVVAVSATVEITEPVEAVDLRLGVGDLTVLAEPGNILLEADLGGLADSELDYEVVDRVLTIDASCAQQSLCGGTMDITMPARTDLTARVSAGTVDLTGLAGRVFVATGTGAIQGGSLATESTTLVVETGDVDLGFRRPPDEVAVSVDVGDVTIKLPSGDYDLQLQVGQGSIDTRGVVDTPGAASLVSVTVQTGAVTIVGR